MAGILAHSLFRFTTGNYNIEDNLKRINPPSVDESVLDKQVGRVLSEKPLLLSNSVFWFMNPFQFLSLPLVLLFSMVVFLIVKILLYNRYKESNTQKEIEDDLVRKSHTPGGRRRMSVSERTVVRNSFIQNYAQEVKIVKSGYLKKRATTNSFAGYQRRYFELDNRKILKYWKSIFDKNEGIKPRRTFNFDDPKKKEPPILSKEDMKENVTSTKIKICFSLDDDDESNVNTAEKNINNEINMQTKEVLDLEAPDIRSANAWREAFKNALK